MPPLRKGADHRHGQREVDLKGTAGLIRGHASNIQGKEQGAALFPLQPPQPTSKQPDQAVRRTEWQLATGRRGDLFNDLAHSIRHVLDIYIVLYCNGQRKSSQLNSLRISSIQVRISVDCVLRDLQTSIILGRYTRLYRLSRLTRIDRRGHDL